MSADSVHAAFDTDWPDACHAFYDHWRALRGAALMPSTEMFLDTMPPEFVSELYIADVQPESSIVRYQGTALAKRWGADLTGQEMAAHRDRALRRELHKVMNAVAHHPCGYFSSSRYPTSHQRLIDVHIIRLPLSVQAGRPGRTVNFTVQDEVLGQEEFAAYGFETLRNAWIDIGAGMPEKPPVRIRT